MPFASLSKRRFKGPPANPSKADRATQKRRQSMLSPVGEQAFKAFSMCIDTSDNPSPSARSSKACKSDASSAAASKRLFSLPDSKSLILPADLSYRGAAEAPGFSVALD